VFKKLLALVTVLAFCFSAAACAANTETESGSDFDYVKKKGKMLVGITVYEPMNYYDENEVLTGFDTELTYIVCGKLGVEPEFVVINWGTKEIELAAKEIDAVWNGLTITEERKVQMSITEPYLKNAQVVVVAAGTDYSSTASLVGKTVVAETGSAGEKVIGEDANLSQADYIAQSTQMNCMMEVAAGTADAAVLDLTLALTLTAPDTAYESLSIVDSLEEEFYGIAFRVGSDITGKVNDILKELYNDGTLGKLASNYNLALADF
jgi:polar amino acid transport system substrate-binding protein